MSTTRQRRNESNETAIKETFIERQARLASENSAKRAKTESAKTESAKSAKTENATVKTLTKYERRESENNVAIRELFKDVEGVTFLTVKGRDGLVIKFNNKRAYEFYFKKNSNIVTLCTTPTIYEAFEKALNKGRKKKIALNVSHHEKWDMKEKIEGLTLKDVTAYSKALIKAIS